MRAFLEHRCVVDHQHGVVAANQLIRLYKQFRLYRRHIPDPGRDKVVQLVILAESKTRGYRLNALPLAGTDQARHVERAHLPSGLMTQSI